MKALPKYLKAGAPPLAMLLLSVGFAMMPSHASAQMRMPASPSTQAQQKADAASTQESQAQITALQQQVITLQAALNRNQTGKTGAAKGTMSGKPARNMGNGSSEMGGMGTGAGMPPMGPMKGKMDQMDAMPPAGIKGKAMKSMECCGMSMGKPMAGGSGMSDDKMGGMSGGSMASMKGKDMAAKPMASAGGQDAPSLLHVGAKNFFLDHQQHLNMTSDQKMQLEKLKSDASQQKMSSQAKIDQSEQDLWVLTSADQPDSAAIDSKVQEVAKVRADEQINFIHSVAMASDVLTPEQRAQVVMPMAPAKGMKPPMAKKPMPGPTKMQ